MVLRRLSAVKGEFTLEQATAAASTEYMEASAVSDSVANLVTKSLENSQIKVEGYNFDLRKHLLQYDDVINQQRAFVYQQRTDALSKATLRPTIEAMLQDELHATIEQYTQGERDEWDLAGLHRERREELAA